MSALFWPETLAPANINMTDSEWLNKSVFMCYDLIQ